MKNKEMRCYQFQALREYGGETGPVWGRRGEREIEEGFLLETVFEPAPKDQQEVGSQKMGLEVLAQNPQWEGRHGMEGTGSWG